MKITDKNDLFWSKINEASKNAYNQYISLKKDNYPTDNDETHALLSANAGYVPASQDVLSYSGSTLSPTSFFLGKDKNDVKARKDELISTISKQLLVPFLTQQQFEKNRCLEVIDELFEIVRFREQVNDFSYGNSQKWVNMAIKFYIVCKSKSGGDYDMKKFYETSNSYWNYKLFPVDSIMIKNVKKDYGLLSLSKKINSPFESPEPWSHCDSKITFKAFGDHVEQKGKPNPPILYEMYNWNPSKQSGKN